MFDVMTDMLSSSVVINPWEQVRELKYVKLKINWSNAGSDIFDHLLRNRVLKLVLKDSFILSDFHLTPTDFKHRNVFSYRNV